MTFDEALDDALSNSDAAARAAHEDEFAALGRKLERRGLAIEAVCARAMQFDVAVPSWGVGVGGTRFGRFPIEGEPRDVWQKLDDCAVIQRLGKTTPAISPHFPWDDVEDFDALQTYAIERGLRFDAVNSNTFQDQVGQERSYKFGSLSHVDAAVREQAIDHNISVIERGVRLGSKALTVWVADGANFPGQDDLAGAFDRYLASMSRIYAALPADWRLFVEHKFMEPAFYATVIQDWGSAYLAVEELGPKAQCLVDLGHHAPNVNVEQIVARLARFGKLGGFHFNDAKYGDDDLDAGSIDPFRLFLVFHELDNAERRGDPDFAPAHMIDQSHNVTDPIESLLASAAAIARAAAKSSLVDREALAEAQRRNDVMEAKELLRRAFEIDVEPLIAEARRRRGGALDPLDAYRRSRWRERKAAERGRSANFGGGIV